MKNILLLFISFWSLCYGLSSCKDDDKVSLTETTLNIENISSYELTTGKISFSGLQENFDSLSGSDIIFCLNDKALFEAKLILPFSSETYDGLCLTKDAENKSYYLQIGYPTESKEDPEQLIPTVGNEFISYLRQQGKLLE